MKPPVHVCLISAELMPNLMPILHFGAQAVHLVVTRDMKSQGKLMGNMLARRHIQAQAHDGVPGSGLPDLLAYAEKLAQELTQNYASADILLNMTGGTKLMAMAFVFGFQNVIDDCQILYTDTDNRRFDRLRGNQYDCIDIPGNLVDVPTYLEARGCRNVHIDSDDAAWRRRVEDPVRAAVTRYLADNAQNLGPNFFSRVNDAVQRCFTRNEKGKEIYAPRDLRKPHFDSENHWHELTWGEILKAELVVELPFAKFRFRDEGAAGYLGGRWIEEYAWLVGRSVGLADFRVGVRFRWQTDTGLASNEFDAIGIHHNHALFVECKTVRFTPKEKGQEIVYKLDALGQRFGRVVGNKLLLSALPLDQAAANRANASGIEVLHSGAVCKFPGRLRKLMG